MWVAPEIDEKADFLKSNKENIKTILVVRF
jgi:hypothetical protein